jgi:amidohydrolase
METDALKTRVQTRIDDIEAELWNISEYLYENPEICFEEFKSSKKLTDTLINAGYQVEYPFGGLDTAFRASYAGISTGPTVAFLAEYDALPVIGHACGHNLIASAAIGAGIGILAVMEELSGTIQVIGTPAEEGGGGKRILADAGIFEDVNAAMMFHPSSKTMVLRGSLASVRLDIEFFGKPSHAAAAPEDGINALDACILTFNNINALRLHLTSRDRIAGIITHGGDAVNIIPAYTRAVFSIRGKTAQRRDRVLEKALNCAEAAAKATGCRLKYGVRPGYAEMVPNKVIAAKFSNNLITLGRQVFEPSSEERMGSTDMGDVSHIVPSIHAYIATVPEDIAGHTEEFREICMSDKGKAAMTDSAKALAMTAVDLICEPQLLNQARDELEAYMHGFD